MLIIAYLKHFTAANTTALACFTQQVCYATYSDASIIPFLYINLHPLA